MHLINFHHTIFHQECIIKKIKSCHTEEQKMNIMANISINVSQFKYQHASAIKMKGQVLAGEDLLSATSGRTFTPLLFLTPPERGSVKRVGIFIKVITTVNSNTTHDGCICKCLLFVC